MKNLLKSLLRTSEAWAVLASILGELVVKAGWVSQADWDKYLAGLIVYVLGRLTSKAAKAAIPPPEK
jgi:hypothetical protein